jgi:hypothetical protein
MKIEVKIFDDNGNLAEEWYSLNAVPTSHVTVSFAGGVAVTDSSGNTYNRKEEERNPPSGLRSQRWLIG